MAKAIWKYELEMEELSQVEMPRGARVLSTHDGHLGIFIWALVDPDAEREKRGFHIVGTGHLVPESVGRFVGTVGDEHRGTPRLRADLPDVFLQALAGQRIQRREWLVEQQ